MMAPMTAFGDFRSFNTALNGVYMWVKKQSFAQYSSNRRL